MRDVALSLNPAGHLATPAGPNIRFVYSLKTDDPIEVNSLEFSIKQI